MKIEKLYSITEVATELSVSRESVEQTVQSKLSKVHIAKKAGYVLTARQVKKIRKAVKKLEL